MKALVKKITTPSQRLKLKYAYRSANHGVWGFFYRFAGLLPASVKLLFKVSPIVKKMDYPKYPIILDISSQIESDDRVHSYEKELETVAWIEKTIKKGDILWDIGANVGAYSLIAAKFHHGNVKVYSFEPSFVNFAQFCKNIALNGCGNTIVPFNIALAGQTSIATFNHHDLIPGGSRHAIGQAVNDNNDAFKPVFVQQMPAVTGDDLVKIFNLPLPTHIKLDVDGNELEILQGMPTVLKNVKSLVVEIGENRESKAILDLLHSSGFKLDSKSVRSKVNANCIFVKL